MKTGGAFGGECTARGLNGLRCDHCGELHLHGGPRDRGEAVLEEKMIGKGETPKDKCIQQLNSQDCGVLATRAWEGASITIKD